VHLAIKHRAEVYVQAKNHKASSSDISESLYGRLLSSAKANTFTVEDIYTANAQGDQNVQVWLNAEKLDSKATSQIKDVSLSVFVGSAGYNGCASFWFPSQKWLPQWWDTGNEFKDSAR
jgi:hypothetical protein